MNEGTKKYIFPCGCETTDGFQYIGFDSLNGGDDFVGCCPICGISFKGKNVVKLEVEGFVKETWEDWRRRNCFVEK